MKKIHWTPKKYKKILKIFKIKLNTLEILKYKRLSFGEKTAF